MEVNFILGEKRRVEVEITSTDSTEFVIRNATYELKKREEIIDNGECTLDEHLLSVMIQPPTVGKYALIFTFEIGGEIMKEKVTVKVDADQ